MSTWTEQYKNRWRQHVSDEEAAYVDAVMASDSATPTERILAALIQRLGREVEDAHEAAWEERMGEDL